MIFFINIKMTTFGIELESTQINLSIHIPSHKTMIILEKAN